MIKQSHISFINVLRRNQFDDIHRENENKIIDVSVIPLNMVSESVVVVIVT